MVLIKRTFTISQLEISVVQIYKKLSPVGMHSDFFFQAHENYNLSLNNYLGSKSAFGFVNMIYSYFIDWHS
jgi:hypothetical protein